MGAADRKSVFISTRRFGRLEDYLLCQTFRDMETTRDDAVTKVERSRMHSLLFPGRRNRRFAAARAKPAGRAEPTTAADPGGVR
jgi:hypothetical protein